MTTKPPVVCDNGTGFVKCGFAGDNFPAHIFPSIIGRPILRSEEKIQDMELKDIMVGDDVTKARDMLETAYPITNGIVQNWEDMTHLYNYTFEERLKIDPSEHKIMLTEAAMNPKKNREKLVESCSRLQLPGRALLDPGGADAVRAGAARGVVVDSGDGVTHIVPVYEGFAARQDQAARRGGAPPDRVHDQAAAAPRVHVQPHRRLRDRPRDQGEGVLRRPRPRAREEAGARDHHRDADVRAAPPPARPAALPPAHRLGAPPRMRNSDAPAARPSSRRYTLPDGRVIKVGAERFEAPEALFNPSLIGVESAGLGEMLFNVINSCDMDVRPDLYKHIVLSGGSTMYPGLPSRLEKEMKKHYLKNVAKGDREILKKLKLRIEDAAKHMVFLGGSVLADIMKEKEAFWMTRAEYQESGMKVLEKCF